MLVEQNATRALEICDRACVQELGRNRFEGAGAELLGNRDVRRMYLGALQVPERARACGVTRHA